MFRLCFALVLVIASAGYAQNWPMFGGNPRRDGWARDQKAFTRENVKGLKLEWKRKLDIVQKEMNSLTVPVAQEQVITHRGFKDLAIVASASDVIYAIDADTGAVFWEHKMATDGTPK